MWLALETALHLADTACCIASRGRSVRSWALGELALLLRYIAALHMMACGPSGIQVRSQSIQPATLKQAPHRSRPPHPLRLRLFPPCDPSSARSASGDHRPPAGRRAALAQLTSIQSTRAQYISPTHLQHHGLVNDSLAGRAQQAPDPITMARQLLCVRPGFAQGASRS